MQDLSSEPSPLESPRISVVIPAYNAAAIVGRAIESALAQTAPPLEVIVIDDGSTDNTADVAAAYEPRIRLLRQENAGPAAARNHGAKVSTGDWIALLDADDSWLPQKLSRQAAFTHDPNVGLVHCVREDRADLVPEEINFDELWQRNHIANSSVIVRKTAFDQVGGFDEDRALISLEDYNLWLRLAAKGWAIATCTETLWRYTPAPGNLSSQTERFARAELVNLEKIARLLSIDEKKVEAKRVVINEEYGRELLHSRNLSSARKMLGTAMRAEPSATRMLLWLATFMPVGLLDMRRSVTDSRRRPALQRGGGG